LHRGACFINYTDTRNWKRYYIKAKKLVTTELEEVEYDKA